MAIQVCTLAGANPTLQGFFFIFPSRLTGRTPDFDSGNVCSNQASGAKYSY